MVTSISAALDVVCQRVSFGKHGNVCDATPSTTDVPEETQEPVVEALEEARHDGSGGGAGRKLEEQRVGSSANRCMRQVLISTYGLTSDATTVHAATCLVAIPRRSPPW
jgi:hypothetical protein